MFQASRIALLLATASLASLTGQSPEPTLAAAVARMQTSDFAGAAVILDAVTKREPKNGRAWRNYGGVLKNLKKYDEAEAAYKTSLEIDPESPVGAYNLAGVYALKSDVAHAFEFLEKAKTFHADLTNLPGDADLASLRADPRFTALIPKPADFAHPFVEPVKILREWDGEAAEDQFGWIARNLGDVDGDHVNDVVTSAPSAQFGGANSGGFYVYSTRTSQLLWRVDGHANDQLGLGVEGAGDANGDGIPDVIASAPGAGKAYIFSGKDGRTLQTFTAEDAADAFGRHVSGVGDVNHDGFADVIVGAPANKANGPGAGRAYVYSGKDGKLLCTLSGERANDAFGSTVGGFSDKLHTLILVGAPGGGPNHTGRTYVYDGLTGTPKFVIESDDTGRALGAMFISVPGDLDGDGFPDVYASDFVNAAKGVSTGRVYLHSGKDGRRLFTLTGETAGEGFGIGVAGAGDVNADGRADLIIGSWQYSGAAASGGRAYLYSGRDGSLLKTYTCRIPGDTFGFDAVGMGDIDGDGTIDFLITSAWSGIHGHHSGRMFIVSSGVSRGK